MCKEVGVFFSLFSTFFPSRVEGGFLEVATCPSSAPAVLVPDLCVLCALFPALFTGSPVCAQLCGDSIPGWFLSSSWPSNFLGAVKPLAPAPPSQPPSPTPQAHWGPLTSNRGEGPGQQRRDRPPQQGQCVFPRSATSVPPLRNMRRSLYFNLCILSSVLVMLLLQLFSGEVTVGPVFSYRGEMESLCPCRF